MDVNFGLRERGQATIMDAILFLLVTSILATTLFYFTAGYGADQEAQLSNRYLRSYASSAYKALLWSPVVREGGFADYLLAYAKEKGPGDVAVKQKFAENLYKLNAPVNASKDYLFAVYEGQNGVGEPKLIVFKEGEGLFYCRDTDDVVFTDAGNTLPSDTGANLTSFIDTSNDLTSTEGIITFENTVFKTILLTWPQGVNTVYDIDNDGVLGDHLCGVENELVLPEGHPQRNDYSGGIPVLPVRVVEVDTNSL